MKFLKYIFFNLPYFLWIPINIFFSKSINPIYYDFVSKDYGSNYDISKKDRLKLLKKFSLIVKNIKSATSIEVHITLAKHLLSLPKDGKNCIVECGCYFGASSASISLICKIINRQLIIYDSFEGLPNMEMEKIRVYPHLLVSGYYKKGMYKSSLDDVKKNIKKYGNIENCLFRKGLFNKSLKVHNEKIDSIFLDVDLTSSTKDCIEYLWPHLINNGYVFTDDACDIEVVKIWFDNLWWTKKFNTNAPGYVGSGCGLPISKNFSSLGYSIKNISYEKLNKIEWLR